jgi:hypothetical protein
LGENERSMLMGVDSLGDEENALKLVIIMVA